MGVISKCVVFHLKCFLCLSIFFQTLSASAQMSGCPDPFANNYDSLATINDGSCTYNPSNYTPPIKVDPIDTALRGSSGLQWAGNSLWSFNDGGGMAAIYRIDTTTGAVLQTVTLSGATNVDWEDLAFDGAYFYIGDFGNNANGARTNLKIYKFPLSSIPVYNISPNVVIPPVDIDVINFTYGDQLQPPVATSANNAKYDCEAMVIDNGKIHLFTKNWIDLTSTHYVINSTASGTYVLTPLETLATNYLVTGADIVKGKKLVVLLGYQNSGFANHFMHLLTGYNGGLYFNGNKRKLNLPDASVMGQAEGITFRDSLYGYISNEKFSYFIINVAQKLRRFNISSFVSGFVESYTFNGAGIWDDASNWSNNAVPPPVASPGSNIIIDPPAGGHCTLNLPYTIAPNVGLTIKPGKSLIVEDNLIVQ